MKKIDKIFKLNFFLWLFPSLYCLNFFCYAQTQMFDPTKNKVSFDESMAPLSRQEVNNEKGVQPYDPLWCITDSDWKWARQTYEVNIIHNFKIDKEFKIPKIIHQIWLGGKLPKKYKKFTDTWKAKHPDWQYKLWTEKEIDQLGLHNKKIFDLAENYAQKADIARYEILYRFGGLYVDTDFECVKAFDVWHHSLDFFVCIEFKRKLRIGNSIIGTYAKHPILKACVENLEDNFFSIELDPNLSERRAFIEKIVAQTGPVYFTNILKKMVLDNSQKIVIFPNSFFFPFSSIEEKKGNVQQFIKPETYAMHRWCLSWLPSNFE